MDTSGHLITHISRRIRLEQGKMSEDKVGRDDLSVSSVENDNFSQKVFLLHHNSVFLITVYNPLLLEWRLHPEKANIENV